jgi:hypothetical protein
MAARKKSSAVDLAPQVDPRAPLDGALLLSKAQGLLADLEVDLLERARGSAPVREALRLRHEAERAARRTADPLEAWERHFVTQVAASWVLSCVFVRTLEDRGLLGHNRIAGPGAADSQRLFFELAPSLTEREYLLTVFRELSRLPAARDLFDARHNPVWLLGPSAELAKKLLALFRGPGTDAPGMRFGQADTRFLGDLYQNLSADVRERFALLQTPHFVEKYILDQTIERALSRFGLDQTTLIDPTCGSGHFLLGAFDRLLDRRLRDEPGLDVREAARKSLDAVYGTDINPYAVAIARFRLTLAFLERAGYLSLADAPHLPLHLAVADSLLHNPQHLQSKLGELPGQSMGTWSSAEFALEDELAARDVLARRFALVVGNPPYITVKDGALRERYRELYTTAFGTFSMAVPFTERFFQLARDGGFIGMITANSFMRNDFGKPFVERFLPTKNLEYVVNASGARFPGHGGMSTVLLFGTNELPQHDQVRVVRAKRKEPDTRERPENGVVWSSITAHGADVGFENAYVAVVLMSRAALRSHPWSLGSTGSAELKELLEARAPERLDEVAEKPIGRAARIGLDKAYVFPSYVATNLAPAGAWREVVVGDATRDWTLGHLDKIIFPYDPARFFALRDETDADLTPALRHLWRYRARLEQRANFVDKHGRPCRPWYAYQQYTTSANRGPLSICFAEISTHNHFGLSIRFGGSTGRCEPVAA